LSKPPSFTWVKHDVLSWDRIDVSGLHISVSLAGTSHRFTLDGRQVEIRLPERPENQPEKSGEDWGNNRIRCYWWKAHRPHAFVVEDVDVFVDVKKRLAVPDERLGVVRHDWFNDAQRGDLDALAGPDPNRWTG